MPGMSKFLSIGEAASRLGVSVATVRRMEERGQLIPIRTEGGHRRFDESQVAALRERLGDPHSRDSTTTPEASPVSGPPVALRKLPEEVLEPPESASTPDHAALGIEIQRVFDEMLESLRAFSLETRSSVGKRDESSQWALTEFDHLKIYGRTLIPYGVSDRWQAHVIRRLEEVLTPEHFHPGLPLHEQRVLVRAEVEEALEGYLTEKDEELSAERETQVYRELCGHGERYAFQRTLNLPFLESRPLREAIKTVLFSSVEADWTDDDVEALVDDFIEEWEEG